ncbi:MAG: universal stress protein [Marivibrio sp.]|uniref:universal stress protein n=1 Tax=Marivibrio sp. TaxID=2039719 RepID=UPI0032F02762
MFKRILTAVDGSDAADKAYKVAADLAEKYGAELSLLYVATADRVSEEERRLAEAEHLADADELHRLRPLEGTADGAYPLPTLLDHSHDVGLTVRTALGRRILDKYAKEAASRGLKVTSADVEKGDAAATILEKADRVRADAIAMGSRGFSDLKGVFLGSTSHKVASRAPCSVLTLAA